MAGVGIRGGKLHLLIGYDRPPAVKNDLNL